MAYRLLSLALSETRPGLGEFNVIALEMSKYNIIPIKLKRTEIVNPSGDIVWDLGRITVAEDIDRDPFILGRNTVYITSNCRLSNETVNLSSILNEYSTVDVEDFFRKNTERFAIVKVKEVSSIQLKTDDISSVKSKLDIYIQGIDRSITLLNKDYRWVKYWQWEVQQKSNDQIRADMQRYANLLNRKDKKLYLILYRHFFEKGNTIETWIAGMHWL